MRWAFSDNCERRSIRQKGNAHETQCHATVATRQAPISTPHPQDQGRRLEKTLPHRPPDRRRPKPTRHRQDALLCQGHRRSRPYRFRADGEAGLINPRGDSGRAKVNEEYILALITAVEGSPRDYGHRWPTWTQELLIRVLAERTGITVSCTTMCRLLRRLGIRRGMPKPIVGCPWSPRARQRRLRLIRRLLETLPPDQAVVFEDEIDVHLNSKVGPDSMNPGQQKRNRWSHPGKASNGTWPAPWTPARID